MQKNKPKESNRIKTSAPPPRKKFFWRLLIAIGNLLPSRKEGKPGAGDSCEPPDSNYTLW